MPGSSLEPNQGFIYLPHTFGLIFLSNTKTKKGYLIYINLTFYAQMVPNVSVWCKYISFGPPVYIPPQDLGSLDPNCLSTLA